MCIYVYIYNITPSTSKRELEYRIPRLRSPVNSQRFPETSVRTNRYS